MIRRRALLAGLVLAGSVAHADPSPMAPIAALNDGLLAVMRAGRSTDFSARTGTLRPLVERAFDLKVILQNSVGPRWAALPDDQKARLLAAFTAFTVATWVANFDSFDGDAFQILPNDRKIGSDDVVQTRIVPKAGEPTRLDYVMRLTGSDWKAVDILLDGTISRVAVQRSDFRSFIKDGGAEPLIAMLRERTASLASGAKR